MVLQMNMASLGSLKSSIFEREERKQQYQAHIRGLNAYDRHKKFVKDYIDFYGKDKNAHAVLPIKTDQDTLREGYRFIRSEEDDMDPSWEQRLVKRYYAKLFKEYCIADMSQYKTGKIGLRWRIEKEVISGKGQFICGNRKCNETDGLASYEVNFSYFEAGENKQALVKLVACKGCAEKLMYKRKKEKERLEKSETEKHKRKREKTRSDGSTDDEYDGSNERKRRGWVTCSNWCWQDKRVRVQQMMRQLMGITILRSFLWECFPDPSVQGLFGMCGAGDWKGPPRASS